MVHDDEQIQLRVVRWIEGVGRQWARLRELDYAEQALDEGADGVKSPTFEAHGKVASHSDPVADLVVVREDKRQRIEDERAAIAEQIHAASAVISRAWSCNPNKDDASFCYVFARYCEGKDKADASRAAGLTSIAAVGAVRKVARFVYQADPSRFGRSVERVDYGHGYAGLRAAATYDNDTTPPSCGR